MRQFAFDLTLIVLQSAGGRFEAGHKPVFSFKDLKYGIKYMEAIPKDFTGHNSAWIGVIYDNEYYSPELLEAIPIMLSQTKADVVSCFKSVEGKNPSIMPRFFRAGVVMAPGTINPLAKDWLVCDRLLNGFIKEQ